MKPTRSRWSRWLGRGGPTDLPLATVLSPAPAASVVVPTVPPVDSVSSDQGISDAAAAARAAEVEHFRRAQAGDFAACEAIVQARRDSMYRLVAGLLENPADIEEVVQEVFFSVFRNLQQFTFDSSPRTWMTRIAINAALMRRRSERRRPLLALADFRSGGANPDMQAMWQQEGSARRGPEALVLSRELGQASQGAMAKLPEKYRLVLQLRDVEELTAEEVAQALGLTIPTVKSRLHRARLAVRHALTGHFEQRPAP